MSALAVIYEPLQDIEKQLNDTEVISDAGVATVGPLAICIGTTQGVVMAFDHAQKLKLLISSEVLGYNTGPVTAIDVSIDGVWVAVGHESGMIAVWDLYKGNVVLSVPQEHSSPITALKFGIDRTRIISTDELGHTLLHSNSVDDVSITSVSLLDSPLNSLSILLPPYMKPPAPSQSRIPSITVLDNVIGHELIAFSSRDNLALASLRPVVQWVYRDGHECIASAWSRSMSNCSYMVSYDGHSLSLYSVNGDLDMVLLSHCDWDDNVVTLDWLGGHMIAVIGDDIAILSTPTLTLLTRIPTPTPTHTCQMGHSLLMLHGKGVGVVKRVPVTELAKNKGVNECVEFIVKACNTAPGDGGIASDRERSAIEKKLVDTLMEAIRSEHANAVSMCLDACGTIGNATMLYSTLLPSLLPLPGALNALEQSIVTHTAPTPIPSTLIDTLIQSMKGNRERIEALLLAIPISTPMIPTVAMEYSLPSVIHRVYGAGSGHELRGFDALLGMSEREGAAHHLFGLLHECMDMGVVRDWLFDRLPQLCKIDAALLVDAIDPLWTATDEPPPSTPIATPISTPVSTPVSTPMKKASAWMQRKLGDKITASPRFQSMLGTPTSTPISTPPQRRMTNAELAHTLITTCPSTPIYLSLAKHHHAGHYILPSPLRRQCVDVLMQTSHEKECIWLVTDATVPDRLDEKLYDDDTVLMDRAHTAGFKAMERLIYSTRGEYSHVIQSFVEETDSGVFAYIHQRFTQGTLRDSPSVSSDWEELTSAIVANMSGLVGIDGAKAVNVALRIVSGDNLTTLLSTLSPMLQYDFLMGVDKRDDDPYLNPTQTELLVELMCIHDPTNVYHYLTSHQFSNLDTITQTCEKHGIINATAYLRERQGDSNGALDLVVKSTRDSIGRLRGAMYTDGDTVTVTAKIYNGVELGVGICQRMGEGEEQWMRLLQCVAVPLVSLRSEETESELETVRQHMKTILVELLQIITLGMIRQGVEPTSIFKFIGGTTLGDARAVLKSVSETYTYETTLRDTAVNIQRNGSAKQQRTLVRLLSKGAVMSSHVCDACGSALKGTNVTVYAHCEHVYHDLCVREGVACPLCNRKPMRQSSPRPSRPLPSDKETQRYVRRVTAILRRLNGDTPISTLASTLMSVVDRGMLYGEESEDVVEDGGGGMRVSDRLPPTMDVEPNRRGVIGDESVWSEVRGTGTTAGGIGMHVDMPRYRSMARKDISIPQM